MELKPEADRAIFDAMRRCDARIVEGGPLAPLCDDSKVAHRLVCAWCGAIIRESEGGTPTSHGICLPCRLLHFPPADRL